MLSAFGDFVRGTCEFMCPVNERKLRERERLLHPLERLVGSQKPINKKGGGNKESKENEVYAADPCKIVKSFSRSAAGHKMPSASDLRPFPVLDKTVSYLIKEIACHEIKTPGWVDRYNFVTDRLRAVRQDMVIQNLPIPECIKLLEPMVKFHVFAGYWLCENPIHLFDPKMNFSFLQECIKRLLVMYDIAEANTVSGEQDLTKAVRDVTCSSTEHITRALYHLINLGNSQSLNEGAMRLMNNNNKCKSCLESEAFQLSLSVWRGNYVHACKAIRKLSPLLCMAAALRLPTIRRHALMVMSTAYSSKSLKFPLKLLQEILLWNDQPQAVEECKYYGVPLSKSEDSEWNLEWNICFQRGHFNMDIKEAQPSRLKWLDQTLPDSSVTKILIAK